VNLYARRGAREYWIIDYRRQRVEVYRRTLTATLALVATLSGDDTLISPLLPDFVLSLARVFRVPPALATLADEG
jgi:Uma2 family endonuclease